MFKIGISGDLLNSENKPCFGDAPLELLKVRKDIVKPTTGIGLSTASKDITEWGRSIAKHLSEYVLDIIEISVTATLKIIKAFTELIVLRALLVVA